MKGMYRVLMALAVVAVVAALTMPSALAQCTTSREFGAQGQGGTTGRIIIDTGANSFPNDGNELASLYDPTDTAKNNGGDHFGGANLCPTASWYVTGGMFLMTDSGIGNSISTGVCDLSGCPAAAAALVSLVEDENGGDAGFVCYNAQETPGDVPGRHYNHQWTGPAAVPDGGVRTDIFESYPTVFVTLSSGPPPGTTITSNYSDLGASAHVAVALPGNPPSSGQPAGEEGCVESYDIVMFHGPGDPGRDRSNWMPVKTIPYAGSDISGDVIAVPCPTEADDTFLAVGATFIGGIQSLLVGAPTAVECDPNLAEPEPDVKPQRKRDRQIQPLGRGR